jgi:hypothetical protein
LSDFEYLHSGDVDLISVHEYATIYVSQKDKITFLNSIGPQAQLDLAAAKNLHKPVYWGETGMTAPPIPNYCKHSEIDYTGASCNDRPSCFENKFSTLFSPESPVAGALIWQAVAGPSGCMDVGHVGDGADATWDPLDQVISNFLNDHPFPFK